MLVRVLALIAALLLPVTLASPALAAPEGKHGSCKRFGQSFASWAQGELPAEFGHPGTVMRVLAQTAPGFAADALHDEMTMQLDAFPGTPYCDRHPVHRL